MADSTGGVFEQQDRSGTLLAGKYRLEKLLGEGGMASVYRARHRNGSRVAIKLLHRVLSVDQDIRERFLREGYAANASGHAGAVHVIDDDVADDGSVFLVMEYLDGICVHDLWTHQRCQLSPQLSFTIVHDLLDILVTAHGHRIVHRDIKPENVFVTREGDIKLLDFGIARLPQSMRSSTPTETGARLGTPAFMPPEQAQGNVREIDMRSDLFGVGAVLFTLMSGQYLFDCTNPGDYLIKAATQPARSLSTLLPGLPESVTHVVDKALSFHKEDRWESALAMREAVRAACEEHYTGLLTKTQLAAFAQPLTEVLEPSTGREPPAPSDSVDDVSARASYGAALDPDAAASAPTLAASESGMRSTDSAAASVSASSFATKPGASRHLWLLGAGAILVLSFSGAIVLGARSSSNESVAAPVVSVLSPESGSPPPVVVAAPETTSSAGPAGSVDASPLVEVTPPLAASAAFPRKSAKGPTTGRAVQPPQPAREPEDTKPASTSAPPEPEEYDPYLYQ